MSEYKTNPYYTHQPYFIEILKQTTGNILECGCGDGSTRMIKEHIKETNRKLVSLESNMQWLTKYIKLADNNHKLHYVPASNDDNNETGNVWVDFIHKNQLNDFEIVFLDQSPWLARIACLNYFLDKAKIIIIHDFDYYPIFNVYGKVSKRESYGDKQKIECDLSDTIKNYKLYYPPYEYFAGASGPPTLICSNVMDSDEFNQLLYNIEKNLHLYY